MVHLHEGQGQTAPGPRLATLENPETGLSGGLNRFSAPVDTVLEPSTEYFLVVEAAARSYNDARTDPYLEAITDFAGQVRATGDWAFAGHLLQEEVYADIVILGRLEGDGNDATNDIVWRTLKRWAEPTRATLKMRFFGHPHETQVEVMTAYGQIGSAVTGWNLHPEAEGYTLEWRRLWQTWQESIDAGQSVSLTRFEAVDQPPNRGASYILSVDGGDIEPAVRYVIRVTGRDPLGGHFGHR